MGLINWLKKLFQKESNILSEDDKICLTHPELKPEPILEDYDERKPFFHPQNQRAFAKSVEEVKRSLEFNRIRRLNQKRRTKFRYSEHFKQRQPTTARKLWKPNAKLEEDN